VLIDVEVLTEVELLVEDVEVVVIIGGTLKLSNITCVAGQSSYLPT
jgi:hypothetical protein